MTPFAADLFEATPISDAFLEHGHERGAGPSLMPDRARMDVSLPLELDEWLAEKAFARGLARAQLVRQILRQERRKDRGFQRRQKVDSTSHPSINFRAGT